MDSGYSLNFWPRRQIDYQTILDMAVGNGGQWEDDCAPPPILAYYTLAPLQSGRGRLCPPSSPNPRIVRISYGPEFWT